MSDESMVPVFIPPLITMLKEHERQKGSPLTEAEVLAIRDKCVTIMMRESMARQMAERRGYNDLNPDRCWKEWQQVRENL
jgi:hypothetical protein